MEKPHSAYKELLETMQEINARNKEPEPERMELPPNLEQSVQNIEKMLCIEEINNPPNPALEFAEHIEAHNKEVEQMETELQLDYLKSIEKGFEGLREHIYELEMDLHVVDIEREQEIERENQLELEREFEQERERGMEFEYIYWFYHQQEIERQREREQERGGYEMDIGF